MAGSQTPSGGDASSKSGKQKYSSRPSFKVGYQSRHAPVSSRQLTLPQSSLQGKINFLGSNIIAVDNFGGSGPPEVTGHGTSSGPSDPPTFVINTPNNMKSRRKRRNPTRPRGLPKPNEAAGQQAFDGASRKRPRPVFRASRPLKNSDQINSDVWQIILGYCEPKQLLEAKTMSREFYRLLSDRAGIWKESRINHFGPDMPECPPSLTEQQYAYLLAGRGCQNPTCPRDQTFRVSWVFQARLCSECFKQKTIRVDDLPAHRRYLIVADESRFSPADDSPLWRAFLSDLLPQAKSDGRRYGGPRAVDDAANNWYRANLRQFVFLKSAYQRLESEYLELRRSNPSNAVVKDWLERTHQKTMKFMIEVADFENWYTNLPQPNQNFYQARADYFEERAAQLSPPMERPVLWNMAAFRRVLKVQTRPTERSWQMLKDKILPYRTQAEQVHEYHILMRITSPPGLTYADLSLYDPQSLPSAPMLERFKRLKQRRSGRKRLLPSFVPEQEFVLALANKELDRCMEAGVADEDLLLLTLKNVFDTYAQLKDRPTGLNFDGTRGPYCLSLDDARMIVEDVIETKVDRLSQRGSIVFSNLRCRGCRRRDFTKTWHFTDAFEHILKAHASLVGEGMEFWQFAVPFTRDKPEWFPGRPEHKSEDQFPWYTLPWPRCLPLVPVHQEPWKLDDWHPAVTQPFVQLEKPPTISAFEGRRPRPRSFYDADFVGNIRFAAQTLKGVWLDELCQMKIALKYAMALCLPGSLTEPPVEIFARGLAEIELVNPAIDLQFRCGICIQEGKVHHNARQVKYRIPIGDLLTHWEEKHKECGFGWSEVMHLPSDSEVLLLINKADEKVQEEKEEARQREASQGDNIRKRPKLKNSVVMHARMARDAFDELFPPVSGSLLPTRMEM
ncbi:hypothetical protein H2202_000942 [Exophiala xenobiotica]|nr:hypothetical protein H2202_000942 [Exophiala xenobiotica]KAK5235946.1 hypothetical protein LTR47_002672 [Exophiala xenobiotica]KAK5253849.1 hypothetical protein LTS06_001655 [Exophiala xenobiotica]KAK5353431.1 hypothetical protein LTR61_003389 [Exophiala xenobiotica]KAK5383327.1 hypothetical protein LTR11_002336 [Exophiala xenobiotica]